MGGMTGYLTAAAVILNANDSAEAIRLMVPPIMIIGEIMSAPKLLQRSAASSSAAPGVHVSRNGRAYTSIQCAMA